MPVGRKIQTAKQQASQEPNYKQLYLESKKNVSLFMKQVEAQLATILAAHQQEKNQLQHQIDRLKAQLAQQNQSSSMASTHRSNNSNNHSSTPKQTLQQSLSKLTNSDKKTLCSDQYFSQPNSFIHQPSPRLTLNPKENKILPEDIKEDLGQLKGRQGVRRERKRERRVLESIDNADNVKDFLKDMREKLKGDGVGVKDQEQLISVITPGFFVRHSEA